jgi:hypothetical protein
MQSAAYRLPGIYLPRGWVNNRPRKLGRRPELENAVPIRMRLGWLALRSLYTVGCTAGASALAPFGSTAGSSRHFQAYRTMSTVHVISIMLR